MNIVGKIVTMRAIEEADLPAFYAWGNDPELWRCLGGWHFPASMNSTHAWFEKMQNDTLNLRLAITTPKDGVLGLANLLDIDWKNRHAFHGMMLGSPETRGKGIGRDTVMAMMRYAFDECGFARLDSTIIEYNDPSVKLYCGKCGWKEEGRQRDWYYREGRFWDRLMIGITRKDYAALVQKTSYWKE